MFQSPHFPPANRSLRRTSPLPRPSLFLASSNIPAYLGSSLSPCSPFGTLPRRTVGQLWPSSPIGGHQRHHPFRLGELAQQQQPYCTVEEIKEGKRRSTIIESGGGGGRRGAEEEVNHYEGDEEEEEGEGDDQHSDSSDGYGLYEKAPDSRPNSSSELKLKVPLPPPPLPPPPIPSYSGKQSSKNGGTKRKKLGKEDGKGELIFKRRSEGRTKLAILLLLLTLCALLMALPPLLLWLSVPSPEWPSSSFFTNRHHSPPAPREKVPEIGEKMRKSGEKEEEEMMMMVVEADKLAEWIGTKSAAQRLRVFEVREGRGKQGKAESIAPSSSSSSSHFLPGARPLPLGSLSHNGVPVHPLQFQRLLRAHAVDSDSLVVLYDRHPHGLLAAYALWIFRLYGHEASFLLNGGLAGWQQSTNSSAESAGREAEEEGEWGERRIGTFRAEWHSQLVATFDDVLANFEMPEQNGDDPPRADIADAQSVEEFDGGRVASGSSSSESAVIFGHIRTAVNIPIERLFSSSPHHRMASSHDLARLFAASGLSPHRPVFVYDGFSSLRAAALWTALKRANYTGAALYFGAWPEWLIRAPDHLKIIPDK